MSCLFATPPVSALLFFAGIGMLTHATASFCNSPRWKPSWQDDFHGDSLNTMYWNVPVSPPVVQRPSHARADCRGHACILLGSCRDASCTADDVYVRNGMLTMRTRHSQQEGLTTGAVNTWGKQAFQPPFRVCVNASLPGDASSRNHSAGLWPAHWLMPFDNSICDPGA